MSGRRPQDFPPGLQGGLEHDEDSHRIGETGQVGSEAPGDINRGHPEQGEPRSDDDEAGASDSQ